jgi:hypothetical protein
VEKPEIEDADTPDGLGSITITIRHFTIEVKLTTSSITAFTKKKKIGGFD